MGIIYPICAVIGTRCDVHLAHQEMHGSEKVPVVQP
jgi:hypothetical protein